MAKELAFVTGASSGIGYQLAKQLAERGYDLAITAQDDRLAGAARDFQAIGAEVIAIQADATQQDEVAAAWKKIELTGRPVTVACINAGIGEGGNFATETSLDQEMAIVALNCGSTVQFAKYVAKQMAQHGSGNILFTASIASETTSPGMAVYSASKAFVLSLSKSLRFELKDVGVNVTALQPGPVDTDFFDVAHMNDTKIGTEGKKSNEPDEVAKVGLDALFDGKEHVYAADFMTKLEGAVANITPSSLQAKMQEKMMEPANK